MVQIKMFRDGDWVYLGIHAHHYDNNVFINFNVHKSKEKGNVQLQI